MLELAIIGGGPAGLSAGLYATRGGLKEVVMLKKVCLEDRLLQVVKWKITPE